jgi:hypothetical protein
LSQLPKPPVGRRRHGAHGLELFWLLVDLLDGLFGLAERAAIKLFHGAESAACRGVESLMI